MSDAAPSNQQTSEPTPTQTVLVTESKRVQQWTTITSDRIDLLAQANDFVRTIVYRTALSMGESGLRDPIPLDGVEAETYYAACRLLTRNFNAGHNPNEINPTSHETFYKTEKT